MKYIALIALSMVGTLQSMTPAYKKRQKASQIVNTVNHYKRARMLVPDYLIHQIHPNLKQQALLHNQEVAEEQAERQRQMWPEQYKKR